MMIGYADGLGEESYKDIRGIIEFLETTSVGRDRVIERRLRVC